MSEKSKDTLRDALNVPLQTLRNNLSRVPKEVLKSKYKNGYDALCNTIRLAASGYARQLVFSGIRIHKDHYVPVRKRIDQIFQQTQILSTLSGDIFQKQDLEAFENHCSALRKLIIEDLEKYYLEHSGLYITEECLEYPDCLPEIYCVVNNCILKGDSWITLEEYKKQQKSA